MFFGKGKLYIGEQTRFPRSKKKRIRKKWEKRDCNWSHWLAPQIVTEFRLEKRSI